MLGGRDRTEENAFLGVLLQSRCWWFVLLYPWSILSADSCMLKSQGVLSE